MIEVQNVGKKFNGNTVLEQISATFDPGKTHLVIGQSGSGKTVLMKSMLGLIIPDTGEITFNGRNMLRMPASQQIEVRKEMGVVFQGGALFDSMTVEENVMFPLRMFQPDSTKNMLRRVDFCLERVNLQQTQKLYPTELSGGMKKRVAIARAIATQPRYLFCDEPNSGLDPKTGMVIDMLISEITREYNITTIVNTHDVNSVLEIGDSISYIYQGHLWWQGDRFNILHNDNAELNDFLFSTSLTRRIRPQTTSPHETR